LSKPWFVEFDFEVLIITTDDELNRGDATFGQFPNAAAQEIQNDVGALKTGFERVRQQQFLRLDDVLSIQSALEENRAGLSKLPGTVLKNQQTGGVVYEPPQDSAEIERPTATPDLAQLEKAGLERKTKVGRTNFYINESMLALLSG